MDSRTCSVSQSVSQSVIHCRLTQFCFVDIPWPFIRNSHQYLQCVSFQFSVQFNQFNILFVCNVHSAKAVYSRPKRPFSRSTSTFGHHLTCLRCTSLSPLQSLSKRIERRAEKSTRNFKKPAKKTKT